MPNTYAHYRFGQEVKNMLPAEVKKIIEDHADIYNIGVHGPDIYSFYHALANDRVNRLCTRQHAEPALRLVEYGAGRIRDMKENEEQTAARLAYMYGVICHFALDAYCHGYVNETRDNQGIAHNLQESEFDRMLMQEDGKDPFSYCPGNSLVDKSEYAKVIAGVSDGVDARTVRRSVRRMRKWCNFYVAPTVFHRAVIYFGLWISGNYKKRTGMILKYKVNLRCADTNKELMRLYGKAKQVAATLIKKYAENVFDEKPFPKVYDECFSPQTSIEQRLDNAMKLV